MAFFNIEKNNNNQSGFFNQNPNMMNQGMQGPMNQGMMPNEWNQGMNMTQQPYPQQPMYNQGGMPNQVLFNQPMNQQFVDLQQAGNSNMDVPQQSMNSDTFISNYNYSNNNFDNTSSIPINQGMNYNGMNQGYNNQMPMYNNNNDMSMNTGAQQSMYNEEPAMPTPNLYNEPQQPTGPSMYNEVNTQQMPILADSAPSMYQEPTPEVKEEVKPEGELSLYKDPNADNQPEATIQPSNDINAPESLETLDVEASLPREDAEKKQEVETLEEPKEEVPTNLDPLNNANNPIPVNPVLAQMELHQDVEEIGNTKEVKANVFAAFGIILGMIIKPGSTMLKNAKRFNKMNKAISIMIWLAVIFLVTCIGVRVLVGSFDRTYSSLTDSYKIVFNPARVFEFSNYFEYIIIAVSISIGGVLLTALIYYASSFLNSKGVHFATYLVVSNLGLIPFICGVIVLCPICMIFSTYLGLGALIFTFLCSLITLLIGMNAVLRFNSINSQIFYHVINLSVITLVALIIFTFMINSGWIVLPNVSI